MIKQEEAEAVRDGILWTFPDAQSDRPKVITDPDADVASIENAGFQLNVSGECFQYSDPEHIVAALADLGYENLLAEHKHLLLGHVLSRARPDLIRVALLADWYLLA